MKRAEDIGGIFLDDVKPAVIQSGALNSVLSRLDEVESEAISTLPQFNDSTEVVKDVPDLPQPLKNYIGLSTEELSWRWLGPGIRYVRIAEAATGPTVGLLRIAPGTRIPMHGHSGNELTMVLAGGYTDATGSYRRGDVAAADIGLVHQPIAEAGQECVCLVVTEGDLQPAGLVVKLVQPLLRLRLRKSKMTELWSH